MSSQGTTSDEESETDPFIAKLDGEKAAPPALVNHLPIEKTAWPWSSVDPAELPRVMWLSIMLCSIIGSFWLLDSLKDTVFATLVGLEHQPVAKVLSVITTLVVVLYYNSLLDRFNAQTLFYFVATAYAVVFMLVALALSNEYIGMANTFANPNRVLGWISYFVIESYGSLLVAMFWAFANSTCSLELASSSYGLILSFAQVGAFFGSTIATYAERFGVAELYGIGGLSCLFTGLIVRGFVSFFPNNLPVPPSAAQAQRSSKNPLSSMCEGLFLVVRYEYVILLFGLSCLDEVVITVLDYEMKVIGRARYGDEPEAAVQFATLMGHFGQVTNVVSFLFSLFGFSFVVQSFGIKRALRLFPALLLLAALGSTFVQGNLWILFGAIATLKAMTYSLNEPAKELMYVPTTDAIKFKAKAWIDVLGMRAMKAMGSAITHTGRNDPALLVRYGSVPTILISMALLGISVLIGKQFEDLMSSGKVIGNVDRTPDDDARSQEVNEGILMKLDLKEEVIAPQQSKKDGR